jgi:hypothetical protein
VAAKEISSKMCLAFSSVAKACVLCAVLHLAFSVAAFSAENMSANEVPAAYSVAHLNAVKRPRGTSSVERVAERDMPIGYFLEQMPDRADVLDLPRDASDVIVAKVAVDGSPVFLGERDQSGAIPKSKLKDILFARAKVLDVRKGHAEVGQLFDVHFGTPGESRDMIYPFTPSQLKREYIVVMYLDAADGKRRLLPFPITQLQYSQWTAERSAYFRLQGQPGSRR